MRDEWLPDKSGQDRRTDVEKRVDDLVAVLVSAGIPKDHADDLKYALDVLADAIIEETRR